MLISQSHLPRFLTVGVVAIVFIIYLLCPSGCLFGGKEHDWDEDEDDQYAGGRDGPPKNAHTKATVVARLTSENASWLPDNFPDWQHNIYTVDDRRAELTVPRNKGRESQVYLTYIIDNYYDLPEYMVFLHAQRYQWHNEDPMYDGVPPLRNLQLPYLDEHGYANMRCTWLLGCPSELHPAMALKKGWRQYDQDKDRVETEAVYAKAFRELFPEVDYAPVKVGVPCGAQFALSRWKVQERPRADYVRIRRWLTKTKLPDNVSGRVLEYSWHIMMGMPYVSCPPAKDCFCEVFGHCNLTCPDDGQCLGRFKLPTYSNLPEEWPEEGPGENGFPAMDWWKEYL